MSGRWSGPRRPTALAWGVAALCAAGLATLPACGPKARPPDIVLITADDLSAADLEPYGHPTIRTPRLLRLAAEGMRFDRAFLTSASCSPSRCSTATGRYPHATGAGRLQRYHDEWMSMLGDDHLKYYRIKEALNKQDDEFFNKLAHTVNSIPLEKRTLGRIFAHALINQPSLLPIAARFFV